MILVNVLEDWSSSRLKHFEECERNFDNYFVMLVHNKCDLSPCLKLLYAINYVMSAFPAMLLSR